MKIKHISLLVLSAAGFLASCSCSNNKQDNALLKNINNALSQVESKAKLTCQDAIDAVVGINPELDPTTYTFKNKGRCFAYDVDAQQFIVMQDDRVLFAPDGYTLNYSLSVFKFTDTYTANTNFSQYLTEAYPGSETLVIKTGLDMGNHHDIHNIYYENNGDARRITLRTSCDYLNIDAPKDEVSHFNVSNNVFVTAAETYHEWGTSAYTKISQGEIMFEPKSSTDMFEIPTECREVVTTKTHPEALVYAQINAPEVPAAPLTLQYIYAYTDLLSPNPGANFFRLAKNVTFPHNPYDEQDHHEKENYWQVTGSVCLDLNGYRITFSNDIDQTKVGGGANDSIHPAILVDASADEADVNCYILDSRNQLFESSGIYTTDCSLIAIGGEHHAANLVINGGKVTATRIKNGDPAVISIGNYSDASKGAFKSNLSMYGGKVVTKAQKGSTPVGGLKCLQPKGLGATLTMVYGNLESDGYCISGMGNGSDKYGGTEISITGGTFKSGLGDDVKSEQYPDPGYGPNFPVLFFPQGGTVDITGGNFYGPSCITAKSGTINVNGGTYVASGEYPTETGDQAGVSGYEAEGSVMCIDAVDARGDGSYVYAGGAHINVVGNIKMTSKNAYIAHIRRWTTLPEKNTGISIERGTFTYHMGDIKTFDTVNHPITVKGGTWTQA